MQQNSIPVLCTRPLPASLVQEAAVSGIVVDELSFIKTENILTVEVQQEIELASIEVATVVFTSMNAVEAVTIFLDGLQPEWKIYAIGITTAKLIREYFGAACIAGSANDAAALADLIVSDAGENGYKEVTFFCGDQRREELPQILRNNNFEVNEIVVYQTIITAHKIEQAYYGVLFFSPSAVISFFSANKLGEKTVLFAIGNTTANEIRKFSTNKIIISDEPGKETLVRKMIEYFGGD